MQVPSGIACTHQALEHKELLEGLVQFWDFAQPQPQPLSYGFNPRLVMKAKYCTFIQSFGAWGGDFFWV